MLIDKIGKIQDFTWLNLGNPVGVNSENFFLKWGDINVILY